MMVKKVSVLGFALVTSLSLTACLQTRQELRGGGGPSTQQTQRAQNQMQQQEQVRSLPPAPVDDQYENQFKELRNRLDILENQLTQSHANATSTLEERQRQNQEMDRRFRAFEEALKNMELQLLGLVKDMHDLKKKDLETSSAVPAKGNFERAEGLFGKKEWQEAILAYESYRDQNPKGKNYAEATYKIGVCFQELNMKDEATAFYNEVVSKFPKSGEAKKANTRLKSVK